MAVYFEESELHVAVGTFTEHKGFMDVVAIKTQNVWNATAHHPSERADVTSVSLGSIMFVTSSPQEAKETLRAWMSDASGRSGYGVHSHEQLRVPRSNPNQFIAIRFRLWRA